MSVVQLVTIVLSVLFFAGVASQVHSGRMLLRYALIWMALSAVAIVGAVCPQLVYALAHFLGFEVPSNFIMFVGMFFLLAICLSLSMIVSKQALKIKSLVQELALLESRIESHHE